MTLIKFFVLIGILSALSFNHAFSFHLFVDDWYQIFGSLYNPEMLRSYLTIHPVSFLEFKLFAGIFKFNPYYWQFLGYLLKVIDALSMWALMVALTQSKRVAFLACLIFAVFVVGIEAVIWASTHSSAIIIPLVNLGVYFWIKSENHKPNKYFFYSLVLFAVSILAEPGRAFITVFLIAIWELLSIYQKFTAKKTFTSLLKVILLFLFMVPLYFFVKKYFNMTPDLKSILLGLSLISFSNIVLTLEKPLFGWTLFPQQFTFWATNLFLFITALLIMLFIWKKQTIYKITLFLCLWIPLFYLPNFLTQAHSRSGVDMESRYYALSAVGIVGLLSYGFSFIKSKYINKIIFLFLLFNIYVTNNILIQHSTFRSISIHNKLWNKIDEDVPKGEKASVFMFMGDDSSLRAKLLDWNDTIPFSVRRDLIKEEEYPFLTNDKDLIAKLVCEKNVAKRFPVIGDVIQEEPIPLNYFHAWELKNGELINRSEEERNQIRRKAKCLSVL